MRHREAQAAALPRRNEVNTEISATRCIAVAVTVATLVLGFAGVATAGKGGQGGGGKPGGGSGSLTLVMVTDQNANQGPNWNDTVTFDVSQNATSEPHVDLTCSQNGTVVYGATTGFYSSYPWPWTQNMTLSSQSWSGGAADCVAKLYYFNGSSSTTLSTVSFTADA